MEKLEEIDVPTEIRNIEAGVKQTLQSVDQKQCSPARGGAADSADYAQHIARNRCAESDIVANTLEKSRRLGLDLKDRRAEEDGRVIEGGLDILGGDEDVGLALDSHGDLGGDHVVVDLALDAGDTEAVDEGDVGALGDVAGGGERDGGAGAGDHGLSGLGEVGLAVLLVVGLPLVAAERETKATLVLVLGWGDGERREGLEGEGGVGGRARLDEGSRQGVDGGRVEGSAVGVGNGDFANGGALVRGVLGLSHQDGTGDGQVGLAGDQGSTAEVGGGADALEDRGEGDEGRDVRVREGVLALGDRGDTSGGQSSREELDVLGLIVSDVLEVVVVVGAVASVHEVLLGELLEGSVVELVLEVLEGESELENGGIDVGVLAGNKRSGRGQRGHQRQSAEDGWLHHDERLLKCVLEEVY